MAVSVVWAERVSEEDAALVANHFMNVTPSSAHGQKAPAKRMVLKKAAAVEENQFYIYENADGEGWVMVAANDVVRPILAYSNEGYFRTDNMPRNVKGWLGKYNKQIKLAEENGVVASEDVQQEWKKLCKGISIKKATPVVAPLIQTKWDQDDPYWNLCPMKGSTHDCYTGCVATAMAQVMYYWKWPKQGTGSYSYKTQTLGLSCSADFANTTYDWDNMLLKYNGYYPEGSSNWTTAGVEAPTTVQKNAIATLMYHCGVAVAMDYNIASAGGSGAYTIRPNASQTTAKCAQNALVQNFGYKSTIKGYYRPGGYGYSAVSDANWHNYLKTELDAARPIMYAGADNEGGHSFICDGYDNTTPTRKYHFNWGWSGYCDGYYDIDNLAPGIGGAGSGNGSYNDDQDIIIGIEPDITGHSVVKNATGCSISSASVAENNKAFTATITPTDATYDFTSLSVKLGSTTLKENTHYTLSSDKTELTILASAITGDNSNDLTITAVWTKNRYKYELLGENCTPVEASGVLAKDAALNLTILPASGYTLADAACWDVEMGDNKLTYGTGFTYNASNGSFGIAKVTGDVNILVYGGQAVNWIANGTLFATTMTSSEKYVLPSKTPEIDCDGREFYGWCATADYSHETTAPTIIQNGDAATQGTTFYAVFATQGTGGGAGNWTLVTDASSLKAGDKLVIANKANDATAGALSSQILGSVESTFDNDNISSVGEGTLEFTLGGTSGSWTLSTSDGSLGATDAKKLAWDDGTTTWSISISSGDATIQNGTESYGRILYNVNNPRFTTYTSNTSTIMLLPQLYRKSSGGSSYTDYTTTCTPPCEGPLTSITINTDNVKKVFTEGEAFTYEGLVVTANYEGCDSKTVTPTSVSTPDMSTAGNKTITVSYTENEITKENTYSITVNALPTYAIRFFNNGVQVGETQNVKEGQAATKPSPDPTPCTDYTFAGWHTEALAEDNTVKPTYVTDFTATKDQDYYAVFSMTEEGEGGSKEVTFTAGTDTSDALTITKEGVTITLTDGTLSRNDNYRCYASNTMTVEATSDITKIILNCNANGTSKGGPGCFTANGYTYSGSVGTWEGSATSVVFTAGQQVQINSMKVTIGSGASSTTYYTTAPACEECTAAVTITKGSASHGSFALDKEGEQSTCDGQLVVTVSDIAPASGYRFQAITQTGIEGAVIDQNAKTVTYAKKANGASTINVVFEEIPSYIVRFFDNGTKISEQEVLENDLPEVPANPTPTCDGYTFVGWWTAELAVTNTEVKEWVSDFTTTKDQDYYAIYKKTETSGSEPVNNTYTFTSKSWADATNSWTSGQDGNQLTSGQGVQVTGSNKAGATLNSSVENVSKVVVSYCTNASKGAGSIKVTVGDDESTKNVTKEGGTSLRNLEFAFENKSGVVTFEVACTTNSIYVNAITITAGGETSTTYYTSTVDCGSTTGVENTSDEKVAVKALMNGQIVIIRGEAVYSVTGVRIQ